MLADSLAFQNLPLRQAWVRCKGIKNRIKTELLYAKLHI